MAKGDSKKAQKVIDKQGGIAQNNLNKIGGDLDMLSYGPDQYSFPSYSAPTLPPKPKPKLGRGIFRTDASPPRTAVPITPAYSGSGMPARPNSLEEAVALANQIAYGGRAQNTVEYWSNNPEHGNVWEKDPEYAWRRMLGEFGGGKDVAIGGPFAGQDFGPGPIGGSQGILNALGGYNEFAQTGGYSERDLQNLRERAMAVPRALYQLGEDELMRGRNLSGGYMPNYASALSRMQRQRNYAMGDMGVNMEAALVDAIRSGKLAGLAGMSGLGMGINQQRLGQAGLQNDLSLGLMGAQVNKSQVPSDFQQGLANVGGVLNFFNPMSWF